MKQVTLLAIISLCLQLLLTSISFIGFQSNYTSTIRTIYNVLNVLSIAGLLPFFIKLYQKQ